MSEEHQQALKHWFGYDSFHGEQERILERIAQGEELCVVMPTGAGKSICYQLPMLMRPGYGLVLSPLIALMHDQVEALRQRGIPAAFINSSQSSAEQHQVLDALRAGQLKLLYVAPERFLLDRFRELIQSIPPNLIAVDEAHCISQWGHDFRPAYHRIWEYEACFEHTQLCAFTATATPVVRDDIREQLRRPGMEDMVSGFQRPNLSFSVIDVSSRKEKKGLLSEMLKERTPTLIYVSSRKDAEELGKDFQIRYYHAGMGTQARTAAQNYFQTDKCPILVATNAFGMGIDRPDIRRVIHFSIPGSLEAYYQEAGRAGRDGNPAQCILFDWFVDMKTQQFLLEQNNPPPDAMKQLEQMIRQLAQGKNTNGLIVLTDEYIAGHISAFENPSQANSGVRLLERMGVCDRAFIRDESIIRLQLTESIDDVLKKYDGIRTQRAMAMTAIAQWLRNAKLPDLITIPSQLATMANLRIDQIHHCLGALRDQKELQWAIDTGECCTIRLTDPEIALNAPSIIDAKALHKKRVSDERRLNDVKSYCYCTDCRQLYICKYFGQRVRKAQSCGSCDNCHSKSRPATPPALRNKEFCIIAKALFNLDNNYGIKRICNMLLGMSDDAGKVELNDNIMFGAFKTLSAGRVMGLLRTMEKTGYIEVTGPYRVLILTPTGIALLQYDK